MDGATLQAKINKAYGKSASKVGFPATLYRSASLINPIANRNVVQTGVMVSFAPSLSYSDYNKPKVPDWTCLVDGALVQIGDWLVGVQGTFYIADLQMTLPIPAVQCDRIVSIIRPSYSTHGPLTPVETTIATALPVFAYTAKDKGSAPAGFVAPTESRADVPELEVYINARNVGDIQKNDVIVDELGNRYVIETYNPTSFGFIVIARLEKP